MRGSISLHTDLFNVRLGEGEFGLDGAGGDAGLVTEIVITEEAVNRIEAI